MIGKSLPCGPWLCLHDELLQAQQHLELDALQFFVEPPPPLSSRVARQDGIAIVPYHGISEPRQSTAGRFLGWVSTQEFGSVLTGLASDSSIRGVVVDINSPGGLHMGTPELVAQIRSLRGSKPMAAVANPIAGSAALQVATSFERFNIVPSGITGGLGSFSLHMDHSEELDKAGIVPTIFRSPEGKNDLNPYEALSDGARQHQQQYIDGLTQEFLEVVAENRGVSVDHAAVSFGGGRGVTASQAMAAGLVDGVATLPETVQQLAEAAPKKEAAGARTETLRRQRALNP